MSATLATRTLADLYLSQGYAEKARDAYASLLRRDPEDAGLSRGLAKAQALINASKKERLGDLLREWVGLACADTSGGSR